MKTAVIITLFVAFVLTGKSYAQTTILHQQQVSETVPMSSVFDTQEIRQLSSYEFDNHFFTSNNDYARKAKTQKIVAWVLAGAGAGLIATGFIVAGQDKNDTGDVIDDTFGGAAYIASGAVLGLGSIPFFILSSKNKKKAGLSGKLMIQPVYVSVPGSKGRVTSGIGINLKF